MRCAIFITALAILSSTCSSHAQDKPVSPPAAATSPATPAAPQTAPPTAPVVPQAPAASTPGTAAPAPAEAATPADSTLEVFYGEDGLPEPVKAMRRRILDATRTGELESLRPVLESNETPPALSGGDSDDPIATLKLLSGDDKGREILAILQE